MPAITTRGTLLLATRSAGKRRELEPLLHEHGWRVVDLDRVGLVEDVAAEDALECAETFEGNALAKARYFHARSGLPTVADDSGLACDALHGAPGVRSKRWGADGRLRGEALDDANNALLIAALDAAAKAGRASRVAHYVCVAAYVDDDREVTARGTTTGHILTQREGTSGFGYDPLFFSDDLGCAFGRATREEKARVSHRGRAVARLMELLAQGS